MDVIERYNALKARVIKRHEEFLRLTEFMENETDYLKSPASTRFHLCQSGGLLRHSVNVAENMLRLRKALAPEIDEESCIITALIHDLGKAGDLLFPVAGDIVQRGRFIGGNIQHRRSQLALRLHAGTHRYR